MTREPVGVKARRLLGAGALTIVRVSGDVVDAVVEGDTGTYELGHDPGRGWHCSCPGRGRCSHTAALRLVTTRQHAPGDRVFRRPAAQFPPPHNHQHDHQEGTAS